MAKSNPSVDFDRPATASWKCTTNGTWSAFSSSSVVSRAVSALCVCSKFGHYPHRLGYICAKFHFFRGLRCLASPRRKFAHSIIQLLSQFIWCPGNRSFRFGMISGVVVFLMPQLHLYSIVWAQYVKKTLVWCCAVQQRAKPSEHQQQHGLSQRRQSLKPWRHISQL